MPLQWDESLSVGVKELDAQHREILTCLRSLGDAIGGGRRNAVAAGLTALHGMVASHFATEQRWMEAHGYPHRDAHVRAHEIGLESLRLAVQAHGRGGLDERFLELVERAARWLEIHLRAEDLRMGMFQGAQREQVAAPESTPGRKR